MPDGVSSDNIFAAGNSSAPVSQNNIFSSSQSSPSGISQGNIFSSTPTQAQQGPGSSLHQAWNLIKGAPAGVAKLLVGVPVEAATALYKTQVEHETDPAKVSPISYGIMKSFQRTAQPWNYAKYAKQEGGVNFGVETLGNLSAVGGGLASGLSKVGSAGDIVNASKFADIADANAAAAKGTEEAASMQAAADQAHATFQDLHTNGTPAQKFVYGLDRVSNLGQRASNAPADVWTKGVPYLAKKAASAPGAGAAIERLSSAVGAVKESGLGQHMLSASHKLFTGLHMTGDQRAATRLVEEASGEFADRRAAYDQIARKAAAVLPNENDQAALFAAKTGLAPVLTDIQRLPEDQQARVLDGVGLTQEQLSKAIDYYNGHLPAEEQARFDSAWQTYQDIMSKDEKDYLAGKGTQTKLSEAALAARKEQIGDQVLSSKTGPIKSKFAAKREQSTSQLADIQKQIAEAQTSNKEKAITAGGKLQEAQSKLEQERLARKVSVAEASRSLDAEKQQLAESAAHSREVARSAQDSAKSNYANRVENINAEAERQSAMQQQAIQQLQTGPNADSPSVQAAIQQRTDALSQVETDRQAQLAQAKSERDQTIVSAKQDATTVKDMAAEHKASLSEKAKSAADKARKESDNSIKEVRDEIALHKATLREAASTTRVKALQTKFTNVQAGIAKLNDREQLALEKVSREIDAAPAKYRTALHASRTVSENLNALAKEITDAGGDGTPLQEMAAGMITTLAEMDKAGIAPNFLKGGDPMSNFTGAPSTSGLLTRKKTGAQFQKTTGKVPLTFKGQRDLFIREAKQRIRNETALKAEDMFSVKPPAEFKDLSGADLRAAMEEKGLIPWDRGISDGRPSLIPDEKIDANTKFMQKTLVDEYSRHFAPAGQAEKLLREYFDPATSTVKKIMTFSPHWHTNHVLMQIMENYVGSEMSLPAQVKFLYKALKQEKGEGFAPEVTSRGLRKGDEPTHLVDEKVMEQAFGPTAKKLMGMADKVPDFGYRLLGRMQDVQREMTYLQGKEKGFSDQGAVARATKILGDYTHSSPLENQVLRRIFPWFHWTKMITRIAVRLPIEDPARMVWMMHLGNIIGNQTQDPKLANDLQLGGGYSLPLGRLGLFSQNPVINPSVQGWGQSINPLLRLGIQATTGTSPARGFKPAFLPGNSGFNTGPKALIADPVALARVTLRTLIPQVKNLENLKAPQALRYESGERVPNKGKYFTGEGRLSRLAEFTGIPFPTQKPGASQ